MKRSAQEISDLEPEADGVDVQSEGDMVVLTPTTPPRRSRAKTQPAAMIELDPDNLPAPVSVAEEKVESLLSSSQVELREPQTVVAQPVRAPNTTEVEVPRLITPDFIGKTKAINAVPREVIERRLDEIDAMFSLRRNTTGAARDNATIMLTMAVWEIMGL